nr:hypothetical protein [Tanacetum cinerariifolium]
MNYKLVVSGNQFNGSVGKARVETVPDKDYILLPLWTKDLLFTSSSKDSSSDGFKPSWEEEKKDTEDTENENSEVPSTEEPRVNQEKDAIVNNTNNINTVRNQSNGSVGKARVETVPDKDYILLPLWTKDLLFSSSSKDSSSDGFKPSWKEEKKDTEDPENENSEVPSTEEPRVNQEKDAIVNNTNNINTVSPTDNAAGIEDNAIDENIVYRCVDDPNIPDLEEIGRFSDAENDDSGADMNNLDTNLQVSPIPTTRIHKDHPLKQVIRDLHSAPQTRRMSKNLEEHEPKKVIQALKDPSRIDAMHEELLQFKLQEVWTLVDLPYGKRAIGSKWVFRNKLDERGIVIRNKVRLVALGLTQEEGTDYDEVFTLVVRIKAIRLFLAHASFKDFVVYQMDVKSDFLYEKIKEEIHSKVDGKKVIISETEIRRDLKFKDEGGVDGLSNEVIFEQLTLMGKPRRQDTELPQTSVPTKTVADEAINEEMYDNLERATTTTSLDAEHDRGNI